MQQCKVQLALTFRCRRPIFNLPPIQQMAWAGFFQTLFTPFLKRGEQLADLGFSVEVADRFINDYRPGDLIEVGVSIDATHQDTLLATWDLMSRVQKFRGFFRPFETIEPLEGRCRVTGKPWPRNPASPVSAERLQEYALALSAENWLTITAYSPLRIKRPDGFKTPRHRYIDPSLLRAHPDLLIQTLVPQQEAPTTPLPWKTSRVTTRWVDLSYGSKTKTIGGIVGTLRLSTLTSSPAWCQALLQSALNGVGKNRTFGFGRFHVAAGDLPPLLLPLTRHRTLLDEALTDEELLAASEHLRDAGPGPDFISGADLLQAGQSAREHLREQVQQGGYRPGPTIERLLRKPSGDYRVLKVGSVVDRLLQRSVATVMAVWLDNFMCPNSYAYRRSRGVAHALQRVAAMQEEGVSWGVKTDIENCFDSINREILFDQLTPLIGPDPLLELLTLWLPKTELGVPQGSPLSPLLSNLYLTDFDALFTDDPTTCLVRYSDDMVLLSSIPHAAEEMRERITTHLKPLKLKISKKKTVAITPDAPLLFLGQQIQDGVISAPPKPPKEEEESNEPISWKNVYDPAWQDGRTVYVTSLVRYASSKGAKLLLQYEAEHRNQYIPWAELQHIVVIGKQRLSGGVIGRAISEGIPISFQHLMGGEHAALSTWRQRLRRDMAPMQRRVFSNEAVRLKWAKAVIKGKVNNQAVVIKRRTKKTPPWLKKGMRRIDRAQTIQELLGVEGNLAKLYFEDFAKLTAPFEFHGRRYYPPDGPVNAMLSFGYTLLYHRLGAALVRQGLDPRIGFMHRPRGRHMVLASDLMEPMRYIIDRTVLSLIKLGMVTPADFEKRPPGKPKWHLSDDTFRTYIRRFEETMATPFLSPFTQRTTTQNCYLDEVARRCIICLRLGAPYEARLLR